MRGSRLLCRGGLVVETLGEHGSVAVRSTVQIDGDMTIIVTRPTIGQKSVLASHVVEAETRIRRIARLVKRTVCIAHGIIVAAVSLAWLYALIDSPILEGRLTTVAAWVGLSVGSTAIVACLLRTSIFRKLFLSSIVNGLSRFRVAWKAPIGGA